MIQVGNISKSFGEIHAVKNISFLAENGQITGLLGPNGAGKTTLMRLITAVLNPDRGRALIDGFDTATASLETQRRLGVLPDGGGLYPRLTARENICYFGRLQGLKGPALEEAITKLNDLLGMDDIIDRRTEGFSHGQRAKVGIARALIHNPPNVMLDEPTNGLDIMSTRAMRQVIGQLKAEGKCVLFSSHIMQEVAALCDRIIIMAQGEIVAQGTADDLRQQTGQDNLEDAFVRLIGSGEGLE